jgi:hypothetical protein
LIEDLGNVKLSESVLAFAESETDLNVSNCISRLHRKNRLNEDIVEELPFLAPYISNFSIENPCELEIHVLEDIL